LESIVIYHLLPTYYAFFFYYFFLVKINNAELDHQDTQKKYIRELLRERERERKKINKKVNSSTKGMGETRIDFVINFHRT
jgi:hypothetical protein